MSSRIPPLLEPYLALPPEASLVLLTSVLGASTNWLVLRFLHSALSEVSSGVSPEDEPKVLLVSFMLDLAFWRENARRLGLDLDKLAAKKRFVFVDGLSGLFLSKQQKASPAKGGNVTLSNSGLESVSEAIHNDAKTLRHSQGTTKIMLIVDQLDLLLAAGGDAVNAVGLGDLLLGLREEVHCTIVSLSADLPLVSNPQTPLEANHAAFLISTAHQADFTMSLRLLDTGTARDVSGVVRVTVGDRATEEDEDIQRKIEEKELLYFVGGDGGVKVFERGQ
ncbi:uncharacterized protein LY89DRAFT_137598 [Mollisia scopiformis]|uniref:Elongator complex protein 6 n=1 Tax=Mollisia scopiformis TaxID=149040 RepID=A0A194X2H0_MOLSC|nr:uncharacterized protein LY89DRAFT_137598 [Mollisia scopiformis]KUJ14391.1 hypothetical protein LY89DRAFT_137598 [Mollisia scopiformis]